MPTTISPTSRAIPSRPLALGAYFLLLGVACGAWVTRIPEIQARLGIGDGELGTTLLASAVGALVAMPLTGRLVPLVGARALAWATAGGICVVLPLIPGAPTRPALMAAFGLFGATGGIYGVVLNAMAVRLEGDLGRSIMSTLHGLFSLGGLVGSGLGSLCIHLGLAAVPTLAGVALGLAVVYALTGPGLPETGPGRDEPGRPRAGRRRPPWRLVALGALALLGLAGEGSMGDWSAVYLRRSLGAGGALAALGYAAFSLGMTAGRFGGDALTARLGDPRVLRLGATLAAVGLGGAVLLAQPGPAIVGFAFVGLGLANAVPILYRGAARTPGVEPMAGIAAASTIGYLGFLAGPPAIGLISRATTLGTALGAVAAAVAVIALGAGLVGRAPADAGTGPGEADAAALDAEPVLQA